MNYATVFSVKDPAEILDISFDETERLDGATITVASPTVTISSVSGSATTGMLMGSPSINAGVITQRVQGGAAGTYVMRCAFDTSDGRHLVEIGLLPVRVLG
jgi:hypothetical protein